MKQHIDDPTTLLLEDTAVDGAARLILRAAMRQNDGTCARKTLVPAIMNEESFNLAASRAVEKGYLIPILGSDRLSVGEPPKETIMWFFNWMSEEGGCECLTSLATEYYSELTLRLLQVVSPLNEWDIIEMLGAPHELGEKAIENAHEHPNIKAEEVEEDEFELYGRQSAWLELRHFQDGFMEEHE